MTLETFYNQLHSRRQVIHQNHMRQIVYLNYLNSVNCKLQIILLQKYHSITLYLFDLNVTFLCLNGFFWFSWNDKIRWKFFSLHNFPRKLFTPHLFSSSYLSSARIMMLDMLTPCFLFLIDVARSIIDLAISSGDLSDDRSFVPTYKMKWSGLLHTDVFT